MFVPPLVQVAARAAVVLVMPPHVRCAHPLHERLELPRASRPQHQVPVIPHQTPRQQLDIKSLKALRQYLEKRLKVPDFPEDHHPAIAAVQHVINQARLDLAEGTWHNSDDMRRWVVVK